MVRWDDKHMYNWIGWMRSLLAMRENINDWTVLPRKLYKFPIFMANNLIISPLVLLALFLMTIPQTIEWSMSLLMRWVNKEMERDALDGIKAFPVLMATLFILIPYAVTWGLPKLIREIKQIRVEKRLQKQADELRQVEEDRRRWEHHRVGMGRAIEELERQQRIIREWRIENDRRKEDFRPKKIVKLHQFGDTPKIRIFTRDEFTVEQNRVASTSTARVRRSRQIRDRGYNNIGNE